MKDLLTLDKDVLEICYVAISEFALYLTIALVVVLGALYFIFKWKKPSVLPSFTKIGLGLIVGYALTLSAVILYMQISRLVIKDEIDKNFWLILGFLVVLASATVLLYFRKKIVAFCIAGAYFILLMALLPADSDYPPISPWGMYLSTLGVIAVATVLIALFARKESISFNTRSLAYAGVCTALSYALSYIKLFSMPLGGSITLASLLPLMIYSYAFGAKKGVFVCVIYGVLQCLQSPQIYHPVQVVIDYPLAFGMIGLTGVFKDIKKINNDYVKFLLGGLLAVALRYVSHVISGYFVFYSWSAFDNAFVYSIAYNAYTFIDYALPVVCAFGLFKSKAFTSLLVEVNSKNQATTLSETDSVNN